MIQFMLDTNIVIYVLNKRPITLLEKFNEHEDRMCISSITAGELVYGIEKSIRKDNNYKSLEVFLSGIKVLDYSERHARHYGMIKAFLHLSGKPIGENDTHIAAHARSEGLILVTNNTGEFSRVEGLRLENWY